jgi:hypothetical protein
MSKEEQSWQIRIAPIRDATAKFKRRKRFHEAPKSTAVIIAPMRARTAAGGTVAAGTRIAVKNRISQRTGVDVEHGSITRNASAPLPLLIVSEHFWQS